MPGAQAQRPSAETPPRTLQNLMAEMFEPTLECNHAHAAELPSATDVLTAPSGWLRANRQTHPSKNAACPRRASATSQPEQLMSNATPSSEVHARVLHARVNEVSRLFTTLAQVDDSLRVFGAATHRYVSQAVSLAEVERLETRLGVSLPDDFRAFLLRVGAGAGPYYGVWAPERIWDETSAWAEDWGSPIHPADPFPFVLPNEQRARSAEPDTWQGPIPVPGSILICHQGCGSFTARALTGAARGTVWDAAWDTGEPTWTPARPPTAWLWRPPEPYAQLQFPSAPTFLDWVQAWVTVALQQLSPPPREHG